MVRPGVFPQNFIAPFQTDLHGVGVDLYASQENKLGHLSLGITRFLGRFQAAYSQ